MIKILQTIKVGAIGYATYVSYNWYELRFGFDILFRRFAIILAIIFVIEFILLFRKGETK